VLPGTAFSTPWRFHTRTEHLLGLPAGVLWLAVLAIAGGVALGAAPPGPPAPLTPVAEVRALIEAGRCDTALSRLQGWAGALPEGLTERERRTLLADCLFALGKFADAAEAYKGTLSLDEKARDATSLRCWQRLPECYRRAGDLERAGQALTDGLGVIPEATRSSLKTAGAAGYSVNRTELDTLAEPAPAWVELARTHEAAGSGPAAVQCYRRILDSSLGAPGLPELATKAADLLRSLGTPTDALPLYLRALDTGLDRCFSTVARLPENQRHLDGVAKPPTLALTQSALGGINECVRAANVGTVLDASSLERLAAAWHAAGAATYKPDATAGALPWTTLAAETAAEPWHSLCLWQAAQACTRVGYGDDAVQLLRRLPVGDDAFGDRMRFTLGLAYLSAGDLRHAEEHIMTVCRSGDAALASQAMLAHAQCAELGLNWDDARRRYEEVRDKAAVTWARTEAAYALRRIEMLCREQKERAIAARRVSTGQTPTALQVLPDDRATRGYWPPGYGSESFVLCAQQTVADRVGGSGPRLRYKVRTNDPKEPGRFWVSRKSETDPAALWDPEQRRHVSANRDDRGEQLPLGEGPDLLVECEVPPGRHVLSLYFVNDYNYYEPKRAYTISTTGADGRPLVVTHVRDFGGGVHKRFAVQGPGSLTFRIWRNVSLNVLLSGIFLDPLVAPRPVPACLGGLERAGRRAAADYTRVADSMRVVKTGVPVAFLADAVRELEAAAPGASAARRPALWWMASECRRVLGQSRRADAAFDQLLEAVPGATPAEPPWRALEALGRELHGKAQAPPPELRWFRDDTHRLDRVWASVFSTWAAASPKQKAGLRHEALRIGQAPDAYVTARARERALAFIGDAPELKPLDAVMLYDTGQGYAKQGRHDAACTYLKRALAARPDPRLRERVLNDLIRAEVLNGTPPADIEAHYRELEGCAVDRALVGSGALQVAQAYARTRDYRQALAWLDRARQRGGPENVIDAQRRRWLEQAEQQGGGTDR